MILFSFSQLSTTYSCSLSPSSHKMAVSPFKAPYSGQVLMVVICCLLPCTAFVSGNFRQFQPTPVSRQIGLVQAFRGRSILAQGEPMATFKWSPLSVLTYLTEVKKLLLPTSEQPNSHQHFNGDAGHIKQYCCSEFSCKRATFW